MARTTRTLTLALVVSLLWPGAGGAAVPVAMTYSDGSDVDQDDMCIWVHPVDPSLSTVIGSDKTSGDIFVYDLDGTVLQKFNTGKPGNIDVRYGFRLGDDCVDLVAFNEKAQQSILVYRVNPDTRELECVDDGNIKTGGNYGFTLYRHIDGRLFAHTGPKSDALIKQYELFDNGSGQVSGSPTGWEFHESTVEGMAGDDETGYIYLGEEGAGIWRVNAMDDTDKVMIASAGDQSGLQTDVEGVTIYYAAGGQGYIIASSQGANKFTIIERKPPHHPVAEFAISGVGSTDGIDVLNISLNGTFSQGIFTVHNGDSCCPVQAVRWEDIAAEVGGLMIDTDYHDPRDNSFCNGQSGSCTDGVLNQDESDIDCGGACDACQNDLACNSDGDCVSGFCHEATCQEPSEDDSPSQDDSPCECSTEEKTVCGLDGITYQNLCFLNCAKAEYAHDGYCESDGFTGAGCRSVPGRSGGSPALLILTGLGLLLLVPRRRNDKCLTGLLLLVGLLACAGCGPGVVEALPAVCGNGTCEADEACQTCSFDCGSCDAEHCGNGVCADSEDCETCPQDCGSCGSECGDGNCDVDENCSNCPDDCGECPPDCGDGDCGADEDCHNCPTDCGDCPSECGDGDCQADESCQNCPTDCGDCPSVCGDGICGDDESCLSCEVDCGACQDGEFQFFVLGDTRSNPDILQVNINSMAALNPATIMAFNTGDITQAGEKDQWDEHHQALASGAPDSSVPADPDGITRQSVFRTDTDNFDEGIRYIGVLGNHDDNSDGWWERWNQYLPGQQQLGHNSETGVYFSLSFDNTLFIILDSVNPSAEQTSWLEETLQGAQSSNYTWIFAMFHHPVYPCNDKGPFDEGVVWVDLFELYGVDIAFVAHSHTYERTCPMLQGRCADGGVIYLNSSGGAASTRAIDAGKSDTVSSGGVTHSYDCSEILELGKSEHHYCHVSINGSVANVDCYDSDNFTSPFDSISLAK